MSSIKPKNKHTVKHFQKNTSPTYCPPNSSHGKNKFKNLTSKQKEVLLLINEGYNPKRLSVKLNISLTAVKDRLNLIIKKGYLIKDTYGYKITKAGKLFINNVKGGSEVCGQKSQHSNEFTVNLQKIPIAFSKGNFFFQSLTADYLHDDLTKVLYLKYKEATVRIFYGKNKKVIFNINNQLGKSFDEIDQKVFRLFVKYYDIISSNGFSLDHSIKPTNPHYANPQGFFAKLSSRHLHNGFWINTDKYDFWVDYSNDEAEEETDNIDIAKRMEKLSDSAIRTSIDFDDLELMRDNLVKLYDSVVIMAKIQSKQIAPQQDNPIHSNIVRPDYYG